MNVLQQQQSSLQAQLKLQFDTACAKLMNTALKEMNARKFTSANSTVGVRVSRRKPSHILIPGAA